MSGTLLLDPGPRYHEVVDTPPFAPNGRRLGSAEPRICTPPLRELNEDASLGYAVIEFATEVLEVDLFPWQKGLLIRALELREDGRFRFRKVVVLVARQSGKSTLSQVLSLFFLYVLGTALVIGTAQDVDLAKEIWQGAVEMAQDIPDLAEQIQGVPRTTNGQIELKLITGERYKVKASNRRAGRGLSGDLILLDELREHQSWEAWGAITKTTMARPNAQIWALSNAGDGTSIVLRHLRKQAHAALGDPDGIIAAENIGKQAPEDGEDADDEVHEDPSLGIFEWSAVPGCDVRDPEGLAQANPSLGYSIQMETLISDSHSDPEWVFRTECMCQWTDGTLEGPFPPGIWEKSSDSASSLPNSAKIAACIDVSADRSHAYVAVAGERSDSRVHVEVIEARRGTEWVIPYLTEVAPNGRPRHEQFDLGVVLQANGAPVSSLLDELNAAGIKVVEWKGADLGRGTGLFYDVVCQDRLRHLGQSALDIAAGTAVTKPLADSWVWDRRKSPTDIAPLVAVTGAVWLVGPKPKTTKTPQIHAWPDEED